MTRICWWLVDVVSQLLEPNERDAVRGDLAESGETGGQALRGLLGLVVRRQAALWKDWRPWLALAGLVGPAGMLLFQFSISLSRTYDLYFWIIGNYRVIDPAILEQTGLTVGHGVALLVCHSFLWVSWSWTGGFVLGSLSRRTLWVNGALFCLVWLSLSCSLRPVSTPKLFTVLFWFPSIWGVRQGLRLGTLRLRQAILLAAAIASMTGLAIWTVGWWPGERSLALSLPVLYMLATASSRRWRDSYRRQFPR